MTTAPVFVSDEPQTDAKGEIFDPELHATKPNGEPALKTDGTFRKKRRDARRSSAAASARTSAPAGTPRVLKEQRERHVRAVTDLAALPTMVLSFVDPVDAYCAQQFTPQLAEALADYALDNPQVAAVLDRASGSGGLLSVLAVVVVAGVQFAHNHNRIPEQYARMMGATPRREIEAVLEQRARAMRAAAGQQEPRDQVVPDAA